MTHESSEIDDQDYFSTEVDRLFGPDKAHRSIPAEGADFEPMLRGRPLVWNIRHLPTEENLEVARSAFGDRADDLLSRWRAAWSSTGVDAEALLAPSGGGVAEGSVALARLLSTTTKDVVGWLAERTDEEGVARLMPVERTWVAVTIPGVDATARPRRLPLPPEESDAIEVLSLLDAGCDVPRRDAAAHILEDAARTVALVAAGTPVTLLVSGVRSRRVVRRRADGGWVVRGLSRTTWTELVASFGSRSAFWGTPAFKATAGRMSRSVEGLAGATVTLLAMARAGREGAFVKDTQHKRGTWTVDLRGVTTVDEAFGALRRAIGSRVFEHFQPRERSHRLRPSGRDPYRLRSWFQSGEATAPGLLIQDLTPFVAEHRFFVVDDRIVGSTASDRGLSVLDAHQGPGRLDRRVARLERPTRPECAPYDRGAQTAVVDRDLVARMARTARRFAAAFKADRAEDHLWEFGAEEPVAYTIDVGLAEDGVVRVIEVNAFRNAGAYAADPERLIGALLARPWVA